MSFAKRDTTYCKVKMPMLLQKSTGIFFLIIRKQNRSIQKTMAFYNKLIIKVKGEAYEKSSIDCRLRSRCACRCAFDLEARASVHWLHAPTYLGIFGCAAVRKATRNMFITNRRLSL